MSEFGLGIEEGSEETRGRDESYRTVLLLGAGVSVAAGVPTTVRFVEDFVRWLAKDHPKQSLLLSKVLVPFRGWAEKRETLADVELLYQILAGMADPDPGFLLERLSKGARILSPLQAQELLRALEHFIRQATFVSQEAVDYLEPLRQFLKPDLPFEIYSTNYDTCIEQVCERMRLRWQDGFELHWDPGVFGRTSDEVNLRKLHGSVLWVQDTEGSYFRVPLRPSPDPRSSMMGLAGPCVPLIAYPGRKQTYEAPFVEALVALQRSLGLTQERVILVVIGYSFRDDHLLQILFDCARRNRNLRVVLVDPEAERIYQKRLGIMPFHGDGKHSPLRGRVLRVCLPVERHLGVLATLRSRLEHYENALKAEDLLLASPSSAASWWRNVPKEFFKAGDLPTVYRYGPELGWEGWPERDEPHARWAAILHELELLILSKSRPPRARGKGSPEAGAKSPGSGVEDAASAVGKESPAAQAARLAVENGLTAEQQRALAGFLRRRSVASRRCVCVTVDPKTGVAKFSTTVPGKVPGSSAEYITTVDPSGASSTVKITRDPGGNVVHVKEK